MDESMVLAASFFAAFGHNLVNLTEFYMVRPILPPSCADVPWQSSPADPGSLGPLLWWLPNH